MGASAMPTVSASEITVAGASTRGDHHDDVVERLYHQAKKDIDGSRWDEVRRAVDYFSPYPGSDFYDSPKGEMDLAYFDHDANAVRYVEVKTQDEKEQRERGLRQLKRAKEHFERLGIEFHGELYVEGEGYMHPTCPAECAYGRYTEDAHVLDAAS